MWAHLPSPSPHRLSPTHPLEDCPQALTTPWNARRLRLSHTLQVPPTPHQMAAGVHLPSSPSRSFPNASPPHPITLLPLRSQECLQAFTSPQKLDGYDSHTTQVPSAPQQEAAGLPPPRPRLCAPLPRNTAMPAGLHLTLLRLRPPHPLTLLAPLCPTHPPQECLQAFTSPEKLDGNDSVRCEACKCPQPHTKRLQVFRYPRVLVLTLKRFSQRAASGPVSFFSRLRSTAKNTTAVALDVDALDLSPFCNQAGLRLQQRQGWPPAPSHTSHTSVAAAGGGAALPVYQLTAVSHHSGSLEGGHYTASGRSAADGSWYSFNDSSVKRDAAARPSGASSTAYVLFYRLQGGS